MKVSLVVASGVHQGKAVPILGPRFLIGRDPECQLRPASQAVSKQHCAVVVRDGKVYVRDLGSTNGTLLNEAVLKDEEREVRPNDLLKVGPLDFTIRIEPTIPKEDGTPLPEMNPEAAAAMAAVKAATAASPAPPARNATPNPTAKAKPPAAKPAPAPAATPAADEHDTATAAPLTGSKEAAALANAAEMEEHDRLAAMLLGLDDGPTEAVPGGTTVVDVPVNLMGLGGEPGKDGAKAAEKKPDTAKADTANAASDLLRRYMRRPK